MIKLRLKRYGRKKQPTYRIIAIHDRARREGRALREVGFYNPRTDEVHLDLPTILFLVRQGAQPTNTVDHILQRAGNLSRSTARNLS